MSSIAIDHALSGSQIPLSGFIADGSYVNGTSPLPGLSCKLTRTAGPGPNEYSAALPSSADNVWSAPFGDLTSGATYSLQVQFTGGYQDVQTGLSVPMPDAPGMSMGPLPPLPPPGPMVRGDYEVKGTYQNGVAVICMAAKIVNKKLVSVEAAASAVMNEKDGTWKATLNIDPPAAGTKLIIVAYLLDENHKVAGRAIRRRGRRE